MDNTCPSELFQHLASDQLNLPHSIGPICPFVSFPTGTPASVQSNTTCFVAAVRNRRLANDGHGHGQHHEAASCAWAIDAYLYCLFLPCLFAAYCLLYVYMAMLRRKDEPTRAGRTPHSGGSLHATGVRGRCLSIVTVTHLRWACLCLVRLTLRLSLWYCKSPGMWCRFAVSSESTSKHELWASWRVDPCLPLLYDWIGRACVDI